MQFLSLVIRRVFSTYSLCTAIIITFICFNLQAQYVFLFSIPKCGTHLLLKCIQQLISRREFPIQGFTQLHMSDYKKAGNAILKGHTVCSERNKQIFHSQKSSGFLIIRDPRDQIVSMVSWIKKHPRIWPQYAQVSKRDILIDLIIDGSKIYTAQFEGPEVGSLTGIQSFYDLYLPWSHEPNILLIKFEDIVGSKGGGDKSKQLQTIQDVAGHLGLEVSESKLQSLTDQLFGGSWTFRKGQIGQWKECFDDELKALFKKYGGKLLIKLEYEKDYDW